jgi:hypothetical protein
MLRDLTTHAAKRAIQMGRISGTKNEINEWQVDPAELHRLYAPIAGRSEATGPATGDAPPADPRQSARGINSTKWRRPSACPTWLTPTRKRSRPRGRAGGAW